MKSSAWFWLFVSVWGCSRPTESPKHESSPDTADPTLEDTDTSSPDEDTGEQDTGSEVDTGEAPDTGVPGIPGIRTESLPLSPCAAPELRTEAHKMQIDTNPIWDTVENGKERFTGFGLTTGDFNADGWDDFFFTDTNPTLLLTDTTGELSHAFTFPTHMVDEPIGSVAGDVDGDGDLDLYIYGYGTHNRLWLNNGTGSFFDVTESAGFDGINEAGTSHASMGDLDGDGDLDLVVGNGRTRFGPNPSDVGLLSQVYENLGDGVFADRSDVLTIEQRHGYNWMFSLVDADGDGDLDMYQVLDFASYDWTNIMMRNDGDWVFTDVSEETYTNLSMDGMGLAVGDYNGDGIPDFAIPDWGPDSVSILESDGVGGWYEASATRGVFEDFDGGSVVGWGTEFLDIDNDTDLDLYMAFGDADCGSVGCSSRENSTKQKSEMWIQTDGMFERQGTAHSLHGLASWRGGVLVDLNRDGWLDIIQERLEEAPVAHIGVCGTAHSLQVRLRDAGPNSHGIGARIRTKIADNVQYRWMLAGSTGHANSGPNWAHFGLGTEEKVDELEVSWPDGEITTFYDIPADQILTIYRSHEEE